jgi:serine/threonine-protein kinase
MSLPAGTRLGPYEITSTIGAGGMGEVYRARDTRLKRDVALKVLPEAFARDADRVARFRREAELLASLNHSNIAAIYGLEETNRVTGLALELVEGQTLADLIGQGPIPITDALAIARQIADALEAAHDKAIIHRDLKPSNIAVADDGTVKVLDFGLAKAIDVAAVPGDPRHSPTVTSPAMTGMGIILGTAAYMSPEQAKGRPADKRCDIWAFGCVLFEMLSGHPPFRGESISDVLAAALMTDPAWTQLPASTPPSVVAVLKACLQKDRKQRVHDIGDVSLALRGAFETTAIQAGQRAAEAAPHWRRVGALAACLLGGVAAGGMAVWLAMRPAAAAVVRTEITTTGPAALLINSFNRDVAITPDGSRIVYRGQAQLLVRALDQLESTALGGLGLPRGVFTSPDGQQVGYFDGNTLLKRVAIGGGTPATICSVDGNGSRGATWAPDGTIVYATNMATTGLHRVSANGGTPTVLTTPDPARGEGDHLWPEFLPGGRSVLFTIASPSGGMENARIGVFDLQTGTYRVVLQGGSHAHYVPTGHLVYGAAGTLRAVGFDLGRLEVSGTPVSILEQVLTTSTGGLDMVFAANGTMVYVPGGVAATAGSLVWVERTGREEPLAAPVRQYTYPRIAPDGTRVAVDIRDQEQDIWTWDLARQTLTRLTFGSTYEAFPVWSPDSRRIIFTSDRSGMSSLVAQPADGTGSAERLTESRNQQRASSVTPDGTQLLFGEMTPRGSDLLVMPLAPPRPSQPLLDTTASERNAELAPNGQWFAYESTESGREEVYVRPFPNIDGGRWQISTGGGRTPMWSRNGRELFYMSPGNFLMGVEVEPGPSWRNTTPVQILKNQYFESGVGSARTFDIAPDGRRFLMIKPGGEHAPRSLIVVQNWFEELKRRVTR